MKGVDIYEGTGPINWGLFDLDFIIPRTGYGTVHEDDRISEYAAGAKAAGVSIPAVYHFSYAFTTDQAESEADFCLSIIKKYGIPCRTVFFDWEYDSDRWMIKQTGRAATPEQLDSFAQAFCRKIEQAGYEAGIYFNLDYMRNRFSTQTLNRYRAWYARYAAKPEIQADVWQYSDNGTVKGIGGPVDLDEMTGGTEDKMNYNKIKSECLGKAYDIDGYYGAQCWDFAAYVMEHYYGGHPIHCGITGYVQDIALTRKTNGILNFMIDVGLQATLQPGDICIWKRGAPDCPLSHIALYDHDNGQSEVYFLGQNQGHPYVTIQRISTAGIIAVFRAKNMAKSEVKPAKPKEGNGRSDWDYNAVLHVGDTVKSKSCYITGVQGKLVDVPELGGLVPLTDVSEAADTKDGKRDNYLATTGSRVYLDPTEVQEVGYNLVRVHATKNDEGEYEGGYWINTGPLAKKV